MPSAAWTLPTHGAFGLICCVLGCAGLASTPAADAAASPASEVAKVAPRVGPSSPETVRQVRYRLLEEQDTDCDQRITRLDQGSRGFSFELDGQRREVRGHYPLANLLQELSLAERAGSAPELARVTEEPVARMARLIRAEYWDALTRRLDADGVPRLLEDPKLRQRAERRLYVPSDDPVAFDYFQGVGRRYDAAYAQLARATAELGLDDLIQVAGAPEQRRVLVAMLRTSNGRGALADLTRGLESISRTLGYPGLSQHLARSLTRMGELIEQAGRSCVHRDATRLTRAAERLSRELSSFSLKRLTVEQLPEPGVWPEWSASLGDLHGPLSLALEQRAGASLTGVPYVVPGGRFDEMYGWDSYFILLGLLSDGRVDLARGIVDNFVYAVEHYHATLNANRTYYLTRSQPPFLPAMIRAVWDATPRDAKNLDWLARAVGATLEEYTNVWATSPRQVPALCRGEGDERACLSRYAGVGRGEPPEVEPGHFAWLWEQTGRSLKWSYERGVLSRRDLTAELDKAFEHDRCMRESGHDTTYRWFWQMTDASGQESFGNRCADMVTVDLNSLLYRYEVDIAHLLRHLLTATAMGQRLERASSLTSAGEPSSWCRRAQHRFELMKDHLWSARDGLFYDALVSPEGTTQTGYVSATTLYPLWATAEPCEPDAALRPRTTLSAEEKSTLVTNALNQLEAPGGLLSTARASRERFSTKADRQWEYPNGWAPHQILAWQGLRAHGFREDAERLCFSWLRTLLANFIDFNGTIPEKYDVVARTHAVFSEYGNVGTEFDYITTEGFGWMNASFQLGLSLLGPSERNDLSRSVSSD
jgi:alpha,alpha-trehalase